MNPIFDLKPWPRIRASAKTGDICPVADSDGHRDRTPGRNAAFAMPIRHQTSTRPLQRCGPIASIAPPSGSDSHKIPI
jgi:hypothetical protein